MIKMNIEQEIEKRARELIGSKESYLYYNLKAKTRRVLNKNYWSLRFQYLPFMIGLFTLAFS